MTFDEMITKWEEITGCTVSDETIIPDQYVCEKQVWFHLFFHDSPNVAYFRRPWPPEFYPKSAAYKSDNPEALDNYIASVAEEALKWREKVINRRKEWKVDTRPVKAVKVKTPQGYSIRWPV